MQAEIEKLKRADETPKGEQWSWNETDIDTWRNGTFSTREEAIKDAILCMKWRKTLGTDEPIIYVGKCEDIPVGTSVDVDMILEHLDENYCSETGCEDYIYEDVTDEQREWLEKKLSDLMNDFHEKIGLKVAWFNVVDIEKVNLREYEEKKHESI